VRWSGHLVGLELDRRVLGGKRRPSGCLRREVVHKTEHSALDRQSPLALPVLAGLYVGCSRSAPCRPAKRSEPGPVAVHARGPSWDVAGRVPRTGAWDARGPTLRDRCLDIRDLTARPVGDASDPRRSSVRPVRMTLLIPGGDLRGGSPRSLTTSWRRCGPAAKTSGGWRRVRKPARPVLTHGRVRPGPSEGAAERCASQILDFAGSAAARSRRRHLA